MDRTIWTKKTEKDNLPYNHYCDYYTTTAAATTATAASTHVPYQTIQPPRNVNCSSAKVAVAEIGAIVVVAVVAVVAVVSVVVVV